MTAHEYKEEGSQTLSFIIIYSLLFIKMKEHEIDHVRP